MISVRTLALVLASVLTVGSPCALAQLTITERLSLTGTVEAVAGGRLTIRDDEGGRHEVRVQKADEQSVPLADGRLLAFPADVRISGPVDPAKLKPGQVVRFRCRLSVRAATDGEVSEITVIDADDATIGVAWSHGPPEAKTAADCVVTAAVLRASKGRLAVELPPDTPFKKKTVIACKLTGNATAVIESRDLRRIEPGATVVRLEGVRLDTGDEVAKTLVAENPAATTIAARGDDALENKYRSLSAEPPIVPRLVRSPHFAFLTDVSDREWAVIRDKLERMVGLLERFFGRKSTGVVEGFIVRDLAAWPRGMLREPMGVEKIRRREGVCFTTSLGPNRRAELYSCTDHGVIQHECVHGFCHLTFGSTGPTWLAEGVAELGNYWRDGDPAVEIDPVVMGYRADRAAWPWKARFRPLAAGARSTATVQAARGWQASGVTVEKDLAYAIAAPGTWRTTTAGEPCDADGDAGRGRLVAAVFHNFTLTAELPLGAAATFVAPTAGQLFLRCADDWTQLADNEGELTVTISRE